jgi:hypothetical protein
MGKEPSAAEKMVGGFASKLVRKRLTKVIQFLLDEDTIRRLNATDGPP